MPGDHTERGQLRRRQFLTGLGAGVGAVLVADMLPWQTPALVLADDLPAGASTFVALDRQFRLADTRQPANGRYPYVTTATSKGRHIRVQVTGRSGVPMDATAAVLTITAINDAGDNFVTAYPSGVTRPDVSILNMAGENQVVANLVTVQLGSDGSVEVESDDDCELIVDVAGVFVPTSAPVRSGRYVGWDTPSRIVDSRQLREGKPAAGGTISVAMPETVPRDATAVMVNLTVTDTEGWGFLTCYPFGQTEVPDSSNVNVDGADQTRASSAVLRLGDAGGDRGFTIWTYSGAHIIVDLLGYFTGDESEVSSDGLFVPATPERIVDTRKPEPQRLWQNWMLEAPAPGVSATSASSLVLNMTAVDALGWGYLSVAPARTYRWSPSVYPETSSVNYTSRGMTVANQVVTRVTEGSGFSIYAYEGCHVLADYFGYFTGTPRQPIVAAPSNPTPPSIGPDWQLTIPRIGHHSTVRDGDSNEVTDAGDTWHWSGTGDMGQAANVAVFAHRTTAGGDP
ncbi:MAG: hypothetical protein EBY57_10185, partial [Actinobacteria bacterium]|nr:hypothetical protein [Actinomycetota bacterium]